MNFDTIFSAALVLMFGVVCYMTGDNAAFMLVLVLNTALFLIIKAVQNELVLRKKGSSK